MEFEQFIPELKECLEGAHIFVCLNRWISWRILPWELEGITSPFYLLIGQYPHHMTACPPVAIVKRCYGIRLYYAYPYMHSSVSIMHTCVVIMNACVVDGSHNQ